MGRLYSSKPNYQNFKTITFRGKEADITDFVLKNAGQHLLHVHMIYDQKNTALGDYANELVRKFDTPTVLFSSDAPPKYLQNCLDDKTYELKESGLLVNLTQLPLRYEPFGAARNGGHSLEPRLIEPYKELIGELGILTQIKQYQEIERFLYDPSIFYAMTLIQKRPIERKQGFWVNLGARLARRKTEDVEVIDPWKYIIKQWAQEHELWDKSVDNLLYLSAGDNVIVPKSESLRNELNFKDYFKILCHFGGWIDFVPGYWERGDFQQRNAVTCNFTTWTRNERIFAFVKHASIELPEDQLSASQKIFMVEVADTFGVKL